MTSIDDMASWLDGLPRLTARAAPLAAEALEGVIRHQITRGLSPSGAPWRKTEEGRQPLQGAAKALVVVPVGRAIVARLQGHVARHNNGTARGGVERQILPTKGLPREYADALRGAITRAFEESKGSL